MKVKNQKSKRDNEIYAPLADRMGMNRIEMNLKICLFNFKFGGKKFNFKQTIRN